MHLRPLQAKRAEAIWPRLLHTTLTFSGEGNGCFGAPLGCAARAPCAARADGKKLLGGKKQLRAPHAGKVPRATHPTLPPEARAPCAATGRSSVVATPWQVRELERAALAVGLGGTTPAQMCGRSSYLGEDGGSDACRARIEPPLPLLLCSPEPPRCVVRWRCAYPTLPNTAGTTR